MHDTLSRRSLFAGALGLTGVALVGREVAAEPIPINDDPRFGVLQSLDLSPFYDGPHPYQHENPHACPEVMWNWPEAPVQRRMLERGIPPGERLNSLTIFRIEDELFFWNGEFVMRGRDRTPLKQHPWTAKIRLVRREDSWKGATN